MQLSNLVDNLDRIHQGHKLKEVYSLALFFSRLIDYHFCCGLKFPVCACLESSSVDFKDLWTMISLKKLKKLGWKPIGG